MLYIVTLIIHTNVALKYLIRLKINFKLICPTTKPFLGQVRMTDVVNFLR